MYLVHHQQAKRAI